MMPIDDQPWRAPLEIVDIPADKVQLAFPRNYFSVTIVGNSFQFSISTDLYGLPAVIERMEKLLEFAELGDMPQAAPRFMRNMEAGDIAAPQEIARTQPIMPRQKGGLARAEQRAAADA